jgi:hypothetical protein
MRKLTLPLALVLIIFSLGIIALGNQNNNLGNVFNTTSVTDNIFTKDTNDDETIYFILFHHLVLVKENVSNDLLEGKTPFDYLESYKSQAKLDDNQTQFLFQAAEDWNNEFKPIDDEINSVVKNTRSQYKDIKIKLTTDIPAPPEELTALWKQKDELVLKYRDILRNTYGEEKFAEFNQFAIDKIAPNIERNIFNKSPQSISKESDSLLDPPLNNGCYGYSLYDVDDDNPAHIRNIETGTVLFCNMIYYYNPGLESFLFEDEILIDGIARGFTQSSYLYDTLGDFIGEAGKTYRIKGDHWVDGWQYYSGYGHYDPYGMNHFQGVYSPPYGFSQGQSSFWIHRLYKAATTQISYTVPQPPLHLASIDRTSGVPSEESVFTAIRGTGLFGPNRSLQVSGSGVTATLANTNPNQIEVQEITINIEPNAARGERQLTLRVNGVTSNPLTFTIGDNSPQITNMTPPEANTGETVSVTISGSHFGFNPLIEIAGTGIQPTITSSSPTSITALFTVLEATTAGQRGVKVKSRGYTGNGFISTPQASDLSNSVSFEVFAPTISIEQFGFIESYGKKEVRVTISNGRQGASYTATLRLGNDFGFMVFDENNQVNLDFTGNGQPVQVKTFKIRSRGSRSYELNDWKLKVVSGNVSDFKLFTVVGLEFEKNSDCSGFDENGENSADPSNEQPYLFVPQSGNNTLKARLVPTGAQGSFRLESATPSAVSVSPTTVTGDGQILTLNSTGTNGDFEINAFGNEATESASKLKVTIRPRLNKTVIIHAITEDNDDVQQILFDSNNQPQGERTQTAIEPASNSLLLTTVTGGDDQIINIGRPDRNGRGRRVINTGLNGIRETQMVTGDVEVIPLNQGRPNSICVLAGDNTELDTNADPNDSVELDEFGKQFINSGQNGLCESKANNTDIVPLESNIPTALDLQNYLNNTTWGKQANVFFTVTRNVTPRQVNFDVNRNGYLDAGFIEFNKISDSISDEGKDVRLYYQKYDIDGNTIVEGQTLFSTLFSRSYFSSNHRDSVNNLAAHEIGHGIGRRLHNPRLGTLMYEFSGVPGYLNPCTITQTDLFRVNPPPTN